MNTEEGEFTKQSAVARMRAGESHLAAHWGETNILVGTKLLKSLLEKHHPQFFGKVMRRLKSGAEWVQNQ